MADRTEDELRAENERLKEELRRADYRFDPRGKLRRGIETNHERLQQIARERRHQTGGGDE
jgi:hypothetical protein